MAEWFAKLKADFILNFIKEDRWKLLVDGLGVTLTVTFFALLIGVVIGIVLGVLMLFDPMLSFVSMGALIGSDLILLGVESIVFFIGNCKYRNW